MGHKSQLQLFVHTFFFFFARRSENQCALVADSSTPGTCAAIAVTAAAMAAADGAVAVSVTVRTVVLVTATGPRRLALPRPLPLPCCPPVRRRRLCSRRSLHSLPDGRAVAVIAAPDAALFSPSRCPSRRRARPQPRPAAAVAAERRRRVGQRRMTGAWGCAGEGKVGTGPRGEAVTGGSDGKVGWAACWTAGRMGGRGKVL